MGEFCAGQTGFEPVISSVTGKRDNQVTLLAQIYEYTAYRLQLIADSKFKSTKIIFAKKMGKVNF